MELRVPYVGVTLVGRGEDVESSRARVWGKSVGKKADHLVENRQLLALHFGLRNYEITPKALEVARSTLCFSQGANLLEHTGRMPRILRDIDSDAVFGVQNYATC